MAKNRAGKAIKSLLKLIDNITPTWPTSGAKSSCSKWAPPCLSRLMADAGKPHGWTLIASRKEVNGRSIRPDGTFKDEMNSSADMGSKDTADKLDAEIEKKEKAATLNNIIFEDTQTRFPSTRPGILSVDMKSRAAAELVPSFFRYVARNRGVRAGRRGVQGASPRPGEGLAKRSSSPSHQSRVQTGLRRLLRALPDQPQPNISRRAVDEMLIQHILTTPDRGIFDNPEFVRRTSSPAEVESDAGDDQPQLRRNTTSGPGPVLRWPSNTARAPMTDWSDKQYSSTRSMSGFPGLNSVSWPTPMGIVYPRRRIVDFHVPRVWPRCWRSEFRQKALDATYTSSTPARAPAISLST